MTKSRTNADNVTADIAGITAGTGITGGGTSGTVTITNDMATTIAAAGDLIYGTANDAYTRLGIGTAGHYLKVNSGATAPEWAAVSAGAGNMVLIASGTLSGTTVTLSSLSTYSELLLLMTGITTTTTGTTYGVRVNNNSGTNYRLLGAVGVNGVEQLFSNPSGDSFYHERDTNNSASNSIAIKLTNTKSTGFTDADYYGFVVGNNGQAYNTVYRGVYGVSEAVSSLVIMNYGAYSFNAGTYALYGG